MIHECALSLAVRVDHLPDRSHALRQILGVRHGMDLYSGSQAEEEEFRYSGDLGCIFQFDNQVSTSRALYV